MITSHCPFCNGVILFAESMKEGTVALCGGCGTIFKYKYNFKTRGEELNMVKLTQSLEHWLFVNHKDKLGLIMFGHTELMTEEMFKEYLKWCETSEGKSYLKGGSNYVEG